ncbi:PaaI family thioesterase [Burkholderia cenocepacia]|uniref:PaaI family thioesterase n=1 Tax=Burkholderia cenocepacia TaxID=95486 RepID=A0ABD4U669_9BURK|nr:PaaI family thioesterase [Burkholderia cenocepacia]MCW3604740.1 PaaI family thioesterase [Burkholderia cenocepacia]MCW3694241.1 PaaI family thioesterase [Burkholderia cenocepacia]MCW3702532.1 PaaI family thioesterase [Burkholderia cenocepacia]MCW3709802.1 PaaI family thioesterase [Burkholderia cenocepacia]MCW3718196.1 PaaI family thioesterase [Burkholderia cenocepacia]
MDDFAVREVLNRLLPPWARLYGLVPISVSSSGIAMRLPYSSGLCHLDDAISNQVLATVADVAMIIAVSAAIGEVRPMSPVYMNTHYVRRVRSGSVFVSAHMSRLFTHTGAGEVEMLDESGCVAVHATATYTMRAA